VIDATLLRNPPPQGTRLGDVDQKLRAALERTGYFERTYLSVPDGFALVTRLEQINSDGTPKAGAARWAVDVDRLTTFSLQAYLKALFFAQPGYFRIIVFIVTPHPFAEATATVAREEAMDWLRQGLLALPDSIGGREYSDQFTCSALIYEFEKPNLGEQARSLMPSPVPGQVHLEKAGVWQALR
jgi:hypothetical protein